MRQYRLLDDGVTTRLNRTIAESRSSGQTHSPSLLYSPTTFSSSPSSSSTQGSSSSNPLSGSGPSSLGAGSRFSSSSAADLGTTTYVASDEACGAFWKELTGYWKGRQDVIRYCIDVVDKGASGSAGSASSLSSSSSRQSSGSSLLGKGGRDDRELDADYQASRPAAAAASRLSEAPSAFPGWDDRGSRAEQSDAALVSDRDCPTIAQHSSALHCTLHLLPSPLPGLTLDPLLRNPLYTASPAAQRAQHRQHHPQPLSTGLQVALHPLPLTSRCGPGGEEVLAGREMK